MPHRTVFQVGKNHVHPFTMFLGGIVVGSIATGTVAWTWATADQTNGDDIQNLTTGKRDSVTSSASPAATVRPSASPTVGF